MFPSIYSFTSRFSPQKILRAAVSTSAEASCHGSNKGLLRDNRSLTTAPLALMDFLLTDGPIDLYCHDAPNRCAITLMRTSSFVQFDFPVSAIATKPIAAQDPTLHVLFGKKDSNRIYLQYCLKEIKVFNQAPPDNYRYHGGLLSIDEESKNVLSALLKGALKGVRGALNEGHNHLDIPATRIIQAAFSQVYENTHTDLDDYFALSASGKAKIFSDFHIKGIFMRIEFDNSLSFFADYPKLKIAIYGDGGGIYLQYDLKEAKVRSLDGEWICLQDWPKQVKIDNFPAAMDCLKKSKEGPGSLHAGLFHMFKEYLSEDVEDSKVGVVKDYAQDTSTNPPEVDISGGNMPHVSK